jgi:hypothetical protein
MCFDVYIIINLQLSTDVFYQMLTYKQESFEYLIDIGLCMHCEYMLEYQELIQQFVSNYVVLLPLF